MAEGRTDPQRRWTIPVCTNGCSLEHGIDHDDYCTGTVEAVVVVPANERLTAEELNRLSYAVGVPVGAKDAELFAKLRRLAGRGDCATCEGSGEEVDGVECHVCSGAGRTR